MSDILLKSDVTTKITAKILTRFYFALWTGMLLLNWTDLNWLELKASVFSSFQDALKVYWQSCLFLSPATVQSSLLQSLSLPPTSPFPCLHNETSKWKTLLGDGQVCQALRTRLHSAVRLSPGLNFELYGSVQTTLLAWHLTFILLHALGLENHIFVAEETLLQNVWRFYMITADLFIMSAIQCTLFMSVSTSALCHNDDYGHPFKTLKTTWLPLPPSNKNVLYSLNSVAFALYADIHFIFTHVWFVSF